MARLFQCGAEIAVGGTATRNESPDGAVSATAPTRDTLTFRSGVASYKCDSTAGNLAVNASTGIPSSLAASTSYFARAYFFAAAAPGSAAHIFRIGSSTLDIAARFRTDGTIELLLHNVVQGSPSALTITDSQWHRIELKGVVNGATQWSDGELLLDGSTVASFTGATQALSGTGGVGWGWVSSLPGANTVINVDDIAVNDSTGSVNNSYPGSGKVVLLEPTADSAVGTGWTNDAASGTNIFNAVLNTPPQGIADTTGGSGLHQIRNSTNNASVNYDATMTTYTAAGVGASDTINAVQCWCASAAPVTTSAKQGTVGVVSNPTIANVSLASTGTAGAFWAGAAAGTYGAGWKWSPGTMTETPTVTLGTAPVMRVTQVTGNTRVAMCCGMFIYVDYTPFVATSRFPRNPAIDFIDPAFV